MSGPEPTHTSDSFVLHKDFNLVATEKSSRRIQSLLALIRRYNGYKFITMRCFPTATGTMLTVTVHRKLPTFISGSPISEGMVRVNQHGIDRDVTHGVVVMDRQGKYTVITANEVSAKCINLINHDN